MLQVSTPPRTLELIAKFDPAVIVVNGTRIISRQILGGSKAMFVNTHTGITPAYRGAHGGYWALYNRDPDRCGVTVHLVGAGIDTGDIIAQRFIKPTTEDSFVSYPYLQTAAALPALVEAVERALNGTLATTVAEGHSAIWYHPGIWQYLRARLRGIK
jgi:methionyl-tRNA formyltransferase